MTSQTLRIVADNSQLIRECEELPRLIAGLPDGLRQVFERLARGLVKNKLVVIEDSGAPLAGDLRITVKLGWYDEFRALALRAHDIHGASPVGDSVSGDSKSTAGDASLSDAIVAKYGLQARAVR